VRNLTRDAVLAERLEVAGDFAARFRGLMGRRELPAGDGLWLTGNSIHMFFMRFAIDAVFLARPGPDGSRRVVGLRRALRPWTGIVWYVRRAAGVIELPSGTIDGSATEVGDDVLLEGVD
jgi:hypothetical protein